jgi:CBS domain containing-hemolysin-like protein
VFIYCELLPKQLFFYSPNRLLRRSGPLLLLFTVLFAPIALCLWLLSWLLERLVGQTPLRVRLALANKELQQVFREGERAGILHPTQREVAQRLFDHSTENIAQYVTPLPRVLAVPLGATVQDALLVARTLKSPIVPVRQPQGRDLVGYVRVIDLKLSGAQHVESVRPLPRVSRGEPFLHALIRLHNEEVDAALVENRSGAPVGLLLTRQLVATLFEKA